jgi:hypothetical protein
MVMVMEMIFGGHGDNSDGDIDEDGSNLWRSGNGDGDCREGEISDNVDRDSGRFFCRDVSGD